jgi:hypothetical protein
VAYAAFTPQALSSHYPSSSSTPSRVTKAPDSPLRGLCLWRREWGAGQTLGEGKKEGYRGPGRDSASSTAAGPLSVVRIQRLESSGFYSGRPRQARPATNARTVTASSPGGGLKLGADTAASALARWTAARWERRGEAFTTVPRSAERRPMAEAIDGQSPMRLLT